MFLKWLGIDDELSDKLSCNIFTKGYRNASTELELEWIDSEDIGLCNEMLGSAEAKFSEHIDDVLRHISDNIDYCFTDEAIIEDIKANELEFTENGNIHN